MLYSSQPATLNYLTTATDLEMVVGANCVDTLVEYDNKGVMREGLATKWEWDADTLTWTFTLREENWVDNLHCRCGRLLQLSRLPDQC